MIKADGFLDWAHKDPGPDNRWAHQGYRRTPMTVITHHSLEGFATLASDPSSGYSVMRSANRFPTAWHFTVLRKNRVWGGKLYKEGDVLQHYPVWARLQHGHWANHLGPGGESEDFAVTGTSLRLTKAQEDSWLRIHADMRELTGIDYKRVPGSAVGLVEHREMTRPQGMTTCPSDLYNKLWERILEGEDDDLSAEQYNELKEKYERLVRQSFGSAEQMEALKDNLPLSKRLNRMEKDDGWLDSRLDMIEDRVTDLEEIDRIINNPYHWHKGGEIVYERKP